MIVTKPARKSRSAAGPKGPAALVAALLVAAAVTAIATHRHAPIPLPGPPGLKVWIASDAEKIRPADPPQPGRISAGLSAACGETASFQIIVVGDRVDLHHTEVHIGALTDAGHHTIPAGSVSLFREATINVETPTLIRPRGNERGLWPDALVPIGADRYFQEPRNGQPFDVPTGSNVAVWVDVAVPANAAPGDYSGAAVITAAGRATVKTPITLHVWDFALPKTWSLPTSFGYDGSFRLQHKSTVVDEATGAAMVRLYVREGLANGVSPWGLWLVNGLPGVEYDPQHPERGVTIPDWSRYDNLYGEAMDGTPEGRANTIDVPPLIVPPAGLTKEQARDETVAAYKAYVKHFREKGWLDRAYLYSVDEPFSAERLEQGKYFSTLWREAYPDGWALATNLYSPELRGSVNLWCVNVNWFDDGEHGHETDTAEHQSAGERVWWYHSDTSRAEPLHRGGAWPSFFIDDTAMSSRIAGAYTWRYGFQGFLYYLTDMAYADPANDPWRNQYYSHGNGDGTLFYPGTPAHIGGEHDIPVSSLRLRFFRQGMQDYEYLARLAALGDRPLADALARKLVPDADKFLEDDDAATVDAIRTQAARRIEDLEHSRANTTNAPKGHS